MERTAIALGGVAIASSIMNASGPHSAERGELYELGARHQGALVFKSCNIAGLDSPDNLKNRGVAHFAAIARDLIPRGKVISGSVVGASDDEIVTVATELDRAGVKIIELNLADDYVAKAIAPFASADRLKGLLDRVRAAISAAIAVKVPPGPSAIDTKSIAALFKSSGVKIALCANDLPKDLEIHRCQIVPKRNASRSAL